MKTAALFLALLLLFGCVPAKPAESVISDTVPEISEPEKTGETEEEIIEKPTEIEYVAPQSKTPEMAVINYFDALYDSYLAMLPIDISPVIDLDFEMMGNVQNWNTLLAMRRSIIAENDYCYVETESFPYTIDYINKKELNDQRMDYVRMSDFGEGAVALHFVIKGVEGKAYPPIFAVNSQHSMVLTFKEGTYKIAYHYFPGSEGKFQNDLPVNLMEKEEMETLLKQEFRQKAEPEVPFSEHERIYNGNAAAGYAAEYCEEQNPAFHFVGDWYGNCMNFASQCIWSGFKTDSETPKGYGGMTKNWYCGKTGGTLIWSSVNRFYEWTTRENCKMQVHKFRDINKVKNGDLVHIGSYACEEEEKYTHALIVADSEKLMLAQNSPACFVYYSDLVNNYARFIRPVSLDV
ncbi:MAG: amidase domain-containing protein [Oscillospiraceae bacterium]|nr:amidase domain-containing protein [Oscillospiraceae bacterium]